MDNDDKIVCKTCGSIYSLQKFKLIIRDKDSEECDICGSTLISWNGAVMYETTLIKKNENWHKTE